MLKIGSVGAALVMHVTMIGKVKSKEQVLVLTVVVYNKCRLLALHASSIEAVFVPVTHYLVSKLILIYTCIILYTEAANVFTACQ